MPRFEDIPQFPRAGYEINVTWDDGLILYLERQDPPFVLEPDYQRGHVWTEQQLNAGGVVHSPEEIARVRALLDKEAAHG